MGITFNNAPTPGIPREICQISLPDANSVMKRGLEYFIGRDYNWLPEYDKIAEWLTDNKHKGLLLFGGNGLGKTVICTQVIPYILKYYLKMDSYTIDAVRLPDYHRNVIDYNEFAYSSMPLIIDDFGIESVSNEYGEKRDLFSEIVDRSEKKKRLLILTTNMTPTEISERYGLRTLDRLKGIVRSIKVNGSSMRN